VDKKTQHPFIAFYPERLLQHPALLKGNRTQSKILNLKSDADLHFEIIYAIMEDTLTLDYKSV
tara:strand:+ start:222 stop:410 length:189 start_codon:yes stop_codon:yes gene_type:complete